MIDKKRITALLLLASIACGLISCGGETPTGGNDTSAQDDTTTTTEPETTAEWTDPGIDFSGETFTIATHQWETPWDIAKYNQITPDEENGDVINDALVKRRRWVEEKFNLKLENFKLEQRDSVNELVNMINAGEDAVDFAMVMSVAMPKLMATQNMVTDLSTIDSIDFTHSWWDQNAVNELNLFGKQYAAIGDVSFFVKGAPVVTIFNKEMIDTYQLDDPYQLVEDGTWTLDKYFAMAEAVAHDLNGNNEIDKDDCFGAALAFSTQEAFMLGCGVKYSKHDSEKIEATIMTERTVTALEKIDKFMKTKSVVMMDGDYSEDGKNVYFSVFIPTLGDNRCLFYSNTLLSAMNMRSMDVDFGVLPMPKYDEEQKTYANSPNTWFTDNVIIPSTNTDPERTGAVIEAMGYYSAQNVTPAFIDNVVMNKTIRDEKSAEMINLVYETVAYDVAQIFNWGGITDTMYVIWFSEGQSYSSVYASYKSAIDKAIEKATAEFKGE